MSSLDPHFTSEEEPQVENYRPLSGLAVTALVLGLLSALAVLSAFMLIAALAGVAVSAAALWRIRASEGDMSGRWMAVLGLTLSLFFGSWGIASVVGSRLILIQQGRRFADGWLRLVQQGELEEAYQWTFSPDARAPANVPLESVYEAGENRESLERYFSATPFGIGSDQTRLLDFRYLGNDSVVTYETGDIAINQRYAVTYEKEGERQTGEILVELRRYAPMEDGVVHWHVYGLRRADQRRPF